MTQYHQLDQRERWIIMCMVQEEGLSRAAAAHAVGCSTRTVTRVLRLHRTTNDVITHHRGGRQREYTQRQMKRLDQLIEYNPAETADGLRAMMGPSAPWVSDQTLRHYRRQLNFSRRQQGIALFDTPQQIEKRHAWARQHRNDPINK